ncbi:MAG: sulfatase/phosphatase domain-containing protein, partial [Segetibacter sp.]
IIAALKETGKDKNTIIIFLSDQGSFHPNTPLRGTKEVGTALYEGAAKIPFFIKWPGITKPNSQVTDHVSSLDVFPTLLHIIGDSPDKYKDLDGMSLRDLIQNNKPLKRDELFFYRSYDDQYASVLGADNWKIVSYRSGKNELFNLNEDISEKNDIASSRPDKVKELTAKLEKWENRVGVSLIKKGQ